MAVKKTGGGAALKPKSTPSISESFDESGRLIARTVDGRTTRRSQLSRTAIREAEERQRLKSKRRTKAADAPLTQAEFDRIFREGIAAGKSSSQILADIDARVAKVRVAREPKPSRRPASVLRAEAQRRARATAQARRAAIAEQRRVAAFEAQQLALLSVVPPAQRQQLLGRERPQTEAEVLAQLAGRGRQPLPSRATTETEVLTELAERDARRQPREPQPLTTPIPVAVPRKRPPPGQELPVPDFLIAAQGALPRDIRTREALTILVPAADPPPKERRLVERAQLIQSLIAGTKTGDVTPTEAREAIRQLNVAPVERRPLRDRARIIPGVGAFLSFQDAKRAGFAPLETGFFITSAALDVLLFWAPARAGVRGGFKVVSKAATRVVPRGTARQIARRTRQLLAEERGAIAISRARPLAETKPAPAKPTRQPITRPIPRPQPSRPPPRRPSPEPVRRRAPGPVRPIPTEPTVPIPRREPAPRPGPGAVPLEEPGFLPGISPLPGPRVLPTVPAPRRILRPIPRPGTRPGVRPKPAARPTPTPEVAQPQVVPRPATGPVTNPLTDPRTDPFTAPRIQPEIRPRIRPRTRPETLPETRPVTRPRTRPETLPEARPFTRPRTRPETRPITRPRIRPETRPRTRPEMRPETRPFTEPRTDPFTRLDPRLDPRRETRPEPRRETRPEPQRFIPRPTPPRFPERFRPPPPPPPFRPPPPPRRPPPGEPPPIRIRPPLRPRFTLPTGRKLPQGVFPETVTWPQGVVNIALNLRTGRTTFKGRPVDKKTPVQGFKVITLTNAPPDPRVLKLGLFNVNVTADSLAFKRTKRKTTLAKTKQFRSRVFA